MVPLHEQEASPETVPRLRGGPLLAFVSASVSGRPARDRRVKTAAGGRTPVRAGRRKGIRLRWGP